MNNETQHSEELFQALQNEKIARRKARKKRLIIILTIIAVVLVAGVLILRGMVRDRFGGSDEEVLSYTAQRGTISTTVSGTGSLSGVDKESIVLPYGVEVTDVVVRNGRSVEQGDVLATVNLATVSSTLATLEEELSDLDEEIQDAEGDKTGTTVKAGVAGRVKAVYAAKGDDITDVMVNYGALAIISLDGYMAVDMESDTLAAGDSVTVTLSDGDTVTGKVDEAMNGKVTILVTDNGPELDEEVTVTDAEGNTIGTGTLYVHKPLSVSAVGGKVAGVSAKLNAKVSSYSTMFTLKDTSYSANYDTLLREREALEEELLLLMNISRDGAVLAPFTGVVSSVDYSESDLVDGEDISLITLYPNEKMSITISVDEGDIMSLEVGQSAEVTVSSVSDDAFTGTVTEIVREADTSSGIAVYSAEVEVAYQDGMLAGMSAEVVVSIEGTENALIVPADAVHQTSTTSYVYTSYDEKEGTYGGMVLVTTGLGNDNYIEITSGLNEGDVVYYVEAQDNFFSMMGGFGGGGMNGMGGNSFGGGNSMPNMGGGSMPVRGDMSGGMPGGR